MTQFLMQSIRSEWSPKRCDSVEKDPVRAIQLVTIKSRSEVTLKKTYSITPQNVPEVNYPMRVAARDGFEILREETQCTCSDWCCWLYGVFTNKCIRGILFFFFIYFRYTYIGRYLLIIIFFNDPWPIFNTNTIK